MLMYAEEWWFKMFDFDQFIWTFIFHIINTIILYFILRRFLFKPVKNFLDEREKRIKRQFEEIDERQLEVQRLQAEYEDKLEQARVEAATIIEQANQLANEHKTAAMEQVKKQLDSMLEQGRRKIEFEKRQAFDLLKSDTAKIAVEIASKILEKNITVEDNQKIIEEFLERVK